MPSVCAMRGSLHQRPHGSPSTHMACGGCRQYGRTRRGDGSSLAAPSQPAAMGGGDVQGWHCIEGAGSVRSKFVSASGTLTACSWHVGHANPRKQPAPRGRQCCARWAPAWGDGPKTSAPCQPGPLLPCSGCPYCAPHPPVTQVRGAVA